MAWSHGIEFRFDTDLGDEFTIYSIRRLVGLLRIGADGKCCRSGFSFGDPHPDNQSSNASWEGTVMSIVT